MSGPLDRRSFLSGLAAVTGVAAPAVPLPPDPPAGQPPEPPHKKTYRQDDAGNWAPIPWEAMLPGDKVVVVDFTKDGFLRVEQWRIAPPGVGTVEIDGKTVPNVAIEAKQDLLPVKPVVFEVPKIYDDEAIIMPRPHLTKEQIDQLHEEIRKRQHEDYVKCIFPKFLYIPAKSANG